MIDLDMTQYLDLFVQEADEQLEILEQETLKLEGDPSSERMNAIFRAAHTLKGSSRAMGFNQIAGLTHEMENVLDLLRAGKLTISKEIANTLLQSQDLLRTMKEAVQDGKGDAGDPTALIRALESFQGRSAPAEAAESSTSPSELPEEVLEALQLAATQSPVFRAKFRLRADCVMKFVRAYMAVKIIQDGGEILVALPDVEALEEEHFDQEFELYFQHSDGLAVLKNKFDGIGEMERFEVQPFGPPANTETKPVQDSPVDPGQAPVAPAPAKRTEANQTVRVDVQRLEDMMNLVGELVIGRTRIAQIGATLAGKYELDENVEALAETVGHIARITSDLQDQLMKARMLPIETVFNRFPRMVRDLAQKLSKDVKLELVGGETELDRSVIEAISDPLLHILRNSIDHGIESAEDRAKSGKPVEGTVTIAARHEENHIVVEILDDGKGIDSQRVKKKALESGLIDAATAERMTDREAVNLIFASGLSTASEVSEVSGRGVGMDIVRSNIQKLGGVIEVESNPGKGSRFTLRLPLTMAIIRGLLVKVAGVVYVLPLSSVVETLKVRRDELQTVQKREVIVLRGVTTPIVRVREIFTSRSFAPEMAEDSMFVVIVGLADRRVGLVVDSLIGEQEVVIKSLSRFCGDVRGISGATILGNGNVALIVDVNGLLSMVNQ